MSQKSRREPGSEHGMGTACHAHRVKVGTLSCSLPTPACASDAGDIGLNAHSVEMNFLSPTPHFPKLH